MKFPWLMVVVIAFACVALYAEEIPSRKVRVSGSYAGLKCHEKIAEGYNKAKGSLGVEVGACPNINGIQALATHDCDVLMFSGQLTEQDKAIWRKAWPKRSKQSGYYLFGQYAVLVIVNRKNPIKSLTLEQFRKIYSGKAKSWTDVSPGILPGKEIICYGQLSTSNTNYIAQTKGLGGESWGSSVKQKISPERARSAVARDPAAIGIFLYKAGMSLDSVKVLGFRINGNKEIVRATTETVFEDKYPLMDTLSLYLHPKAPPEAKAYCEYACSEAAKKVVSEYYLFHISDYKKILEAKRLAAMRAGQGIRMSAVGVRAGRGLLKGLAVEYVRAKAVVQMGYSVAGDLRAIEQFVRSGAGAKELMILDGPPSKRAIERHGEKFKALKTQKYPLAGKAVAVVVNSLNKLDSLSMAQLRKIYGGKTKDWKTLTTEPQRLQRTAERQGVGKETTTAKNGGRRAVKSTIDNRKSKIECYAIRRPDAAAMLFHKKVLVHHKCSALRRRSTLKNTANVLKAVSIDPQAIAFVDTAALARAEKNPAIKILKIGKAPVLPTAKNVMSEAYPISQKLTLYVSPQASETTKDFIKFILSGQCKETFHKNGLLPAR